MHEFLFALILFVTSLSFFDFSFIYLIVYFLKCAPSLNVYKGGSNILMRETKESLYSLFSGLFLFLFAYFVLFHFEYYFFFDISPSLCEIVRFHT